MALWNSSAQSERGPGVWLVLSFGSWLGLVRTRDQRLNLGFEEVMKEVDCACVCNWESVCMHVERSVLLLEPSTTTLHKCLQLSWQCFLDREQEKYRVQEVKKQHTYFSKVWVKRKVYLMTRVFKLMAWQYKRLRAGWEVDMTDDSLISELKGGPIPIYWTLT